MSQTPSRSRGRPARTPEQLQQGRRLIIEAAKELFLVDGYQGVSMRKIASKAKCLPATVYSLFPNKRQILYQLWELIFIEFFQELESVYEESAQSYRLEALCIKYIDFWLAHPDDYISIFLIDERSDRTSKDDIDYFINDSQIVEKIYIFLKAIEEGQSLGQIHSGKPEEIFSIIFCTIQGVTFNLITIPEYPWIDPQRIKVETVRTLIKGLQKETF